MNNLLVVQIHGVDEFVSTHVVKLFLIFYSSKESNNFSWINIIPIYILNE